MIGWIFDSLMAANRFTEKRNETEFAQRLMEANSAKLRSRNRFDRVFEKWQHFQWRSNADW